MRHMASIQFTVESNGVGEEIIDVQQSMHSSIELITLKITVVLYPEKFFFAITFFHLFTELHSAYGKSTMVT